MVCVSLAFVGSVGCSVLASHLDSQLCSPAPLHMVFGVERRASSGPMTGRGSSVTNCFLCVYVCAMPSVALFAGRRHAVSFVVQHAKTLELLICFIQPCHPTLSPNPVTQPSHPTQSSNPVIQPCHPYQSCNPAAAVVPHVPWSAWRARAYHPSSSFCFFLSVARRLCVAPHMGRLQCQSDRQLASDCTTPSTCFRIFQFAVSFVLRFAYTAQHT